MKHCRWFTVLGIAATLGMVLAAQAGGEKAPSRPGARTDQEQAEICVKRRAWIAYFRSDDGKLSPVRDTQNTDSDQDWLGLHFTDYEGPRIRLGVLKVLNNSAEAADSATGKIEVPVAGIQETLTVALFNSKRFDVIEQQRIPEVEAQQRRKDVVEPSPTANLNLGKVVGAQYLVYGTVNEWTPHRASTGVASRFPGFGAVKADKNEAEVDMTFALTDVANGQILFTTTERARLGSSSLGVKVAGVGGGGGAETVPVSYAVRSCANKAALKIATFLRDRKWKGTVVEVKQPDIFVNAGKQQGMAPQTMLTVQAVRAIIVDRETGLVLGEDLRGIGSLEVVAVQSGFSVARVVEGCKTLKIGDRVELVTNPAPPERVAGCDALDGTQGP